MPTAIARAPSRVSLAGGGTDLPEYYELHGGAVVSFAIDLHATATIAPRGSGLDLVSEDSGEREHIPESQLDRRVRPPILAEEYLVYQKAVAWRFGIERARISVTSTIPPGAGLASSGAVGVALVQAAALFAGLEFDRRQVAETASRIEMDVLRHGCGKQDQYASTFGGLNLLEFFPDGSVDVTPLAVGHDVIEALERQILLFHDGRKRDAYGPLHEQARRTANDRTTVRALHKLKDMAFQMRTVLEAGNVDKVGRMLDEAWEAKQHLNSQVSTPEIARVYALARRAGATGGKLAGAGLAGTMVLHCPERRQDELRRAMAAEGWREQPMRIDMEGASGAVGADHGLVTD